MKKLKSVFWSMIIIACLGAVLYSSFTLYSIYNDYKIAEDEYDRLKEIAQTNEDMPDDADTKELISPSDEDSDFSDYQSPINFDQLMTINPDIIGWIVIEDTDIDYPILQAEDNSFYLKTTVEGVASSSGAIFMDYRNSSDFSDNNSIIYGHKMRNGTMFQDLSEYKSQNFFNEHPYYTIYTPECEYRCEVFAAYVTSSVSEAYVLDFSSADNFVQYLNTAISKSLIKTGTILYGTDRIVTLSTCDYTYNNARMVVHARITLI